MLLATPPHQDGGRGVEFRKVKVKKLFGEDEDALVIQSTILQLQVMINQIFKPGSLAKSGTTNAAHGWDSWTFYASDSYMCW